MNSHKSPKILQGYITCLLVTAWLFTAHESVSATRVSTASGSFHLASTWSPTGVPTASDDIIISAGHTVTVSSGSTINKLTVSAGASLKWSSPAILILNGDLDVEGTFDLSGGNVMLSQQGKAFSIQNGGTVIWDPADNTAAGASLFINGTEDFQPSSNLIIKKWYNYQSVPLKNVMTGNFGNLTLTTISGGLLFEWNQKNGFETHKILGKLTVDQGWIVFDNTGSISNTEIGEIELKNINSYLDFHSGDHPGSFTVKTGSLTNIGGTMNGLVNGDGNITLKVTGDFTNVGYAVLNYNSGVIGKGNGNATLQVDGKFRQPGGDFRGIFNLSTTTAGIARITLQDAEITGGQFMGHYACHTGGMNSILYIRGKLKLNMQSSQSRFRGNGLTSLGGINSNAGLDIRIDGATTIGGHPASEFTSSASTGNESFTTYGNLTLNGSQISLNYGMHSVVASFNKPVTINGASVTLSKTSGSLTSVFNDSLTLINGDIAFKGESGPSTIVVNGAYTQQGGTLWLYANATTPANTAVYMIINGAYDHSGGSFIFDSNGASTVPHHCSVAGSSFSVSGNATIGSANTGNVRSELQFDYPGIMTYLSSGNSWTIQQTLQKITNGCTVKVMTGDVQVASSDVAGQSHLIIENGGILDLGNHQVISNGIKSHSMISVGQGGMLKTSRQEGLYNGTSGAAIHASGNMTYTLDESSTICYYGSGPLTVTGNNTGNATGTDKQYGILKIALDTQSSEAILTSGSITVREKLELTKGILDLQGNELSVLNGAPGSVSSHSGSIRSEGSGTIYILKPKKGEHTWNFCTTNGIQLPFVFNPETDAPSYLRVSTRSTNPDNFPYPSNPAGNQVTNLLVEGTHAAARMTDRWYFIESPGTKASLKLSYAEEESTIPSSLLNENISITSWNGSEWNLPFGSGTPTDGTGSAEAQSISSWGVFTMVAWPLERQADVMQFTAEKEKSAVVTRWTAKASTDARYFTVQKSADGSAFEDIETIQAISSTVPRDYTFNDLHPFTGKSWYRLKQTDYSGTVKYSNKIPVEYNQADGSMSVVTLSPNPFSTSFQVTCDIPEAGTLNMKLLGTNGQELDSRTYEAEQGRQSFVWHDTRNLPKGIYLLWITNGKHNTATKIYKQ